MATLLVAAGGAAVGNLIPGTFLGMTGAGIGWSVGSVAGNMLFGPGGQDVTVEGPRLSDLAVTSAAYGKPMPIFYGTLRMGGNVIWSEGIEEVRSTHKQSSGKGGSSTQTSITYAYFGTFFVSFGGIEADDVLRVWGDGKLVYDKTTADDDIIKVGLVFRFYSGAEDQEPDGIIETAAGVGSTPAFRGQCGILFDRLPLADFGNRIPNITAELTTSFTASQNTQNADWFTVGEGGIASTWQTNGLVPDMDRGVCYTSQASLTVGSNILRRLNTRTMVEDRQRAYTTDGNDDDIKLLIIRAVMPNGYIIATSEYSGLTTEPIHQIDPNSLDIISTFGTAVASRIVSFRTACNWFT